MGKKLFYCNLVWSNDIQLFFWPLLSPGKNQLLRHASLMVELSLEWTQYKHCRSRYYVTGNQETFSTETMTLILHPIIINQTWPGPGWCLEKIPKTRKSFDFQTPLVQLDALPRKVLTDRSIPPMAADHLHSAISLLCSSANLTNLAIRHWFRGVPVDVASSSIKCKDCKNIYHELLSTIHY